MDDHADITTTEARRGAATYWRDTITGLQEPPDDAEIDRILAAIEAEAAAQAEARVVQWREAFASVGEQWAAVLEHFGLAEDATAADVIELAERDWTMYPATPTATEVPPAADVADAESEPRNVLLRKLRPAERHAIEAILDRVSADPDDDAAIAARAALRLASEPRDVLDLDSEKRVTVERMDRALRRVLPADVVFALRPTGDPFPGWAAALLNALASEQGVRDG